MTLIVVIVILVALLGYGVFLYNKFVKLVFRVEEAWSGIDVQLKRRHDLVPSLVEVVKGYAEHEQETLKEVVRLRGEMQNTKESGEREGGEKELSRDIGKLFALAESYPDLKANKNYQDLQANLTDIEDDLQYARRYYNGTVRDFNVLVLSFPSNLIAGLVAYKQKPFFEVEYVTERKNPDVDFS